MQVSTKNCYLCNKDILTPLALGNELRLVQCQRCSLVFLDWPGDSGEYIQAMENDFFGRGAISKRDAWARWFSLYQAKRRLKLITRYCQSGALLEIGSGTGEFLSVAQQAGFRSVGLELSAEMAEYATTNYSVPVYRKRLEQMPLEEKFDVVVMNHVLEHMEAPVQALARIKQLMAADSILYIAVPNIASWEAHFRGWTSYEPYHLFYYSPATLTETLKRAGFRVLSSSTFEPFSGWMNTLLRSTLQARYQAARAQAYNCDHARSYRKLATMTVLNMARLTFGCVTAPLRWMQANLGKGEELITIAVPYGTE